MGDDLIQGAGGGRGGSSQAQAQPGSSRPDIEMGAMNPTAPGKAAPGGTPETDSTRPLLKPGAASNQSSRTDTPVIGPSAPSAASGSNPQPEAPPAAPPQMNNPPTIVDWSENDPENPVNWSKTRKSIRLAGVFLQTILIHFGAFMLVPLIPVLRNRPEVDHNLERVSLLVGLYLVGFAVGPAFWRPLCETRGTLPMEATATVLFGFLTLGPVYRPDPIPIWGLTLLRLFAGAFGSAALTNGPAVIEELLPGGAGKWWRLAYAMAQTLGFTIGPLVTIYSGWETDTKNWRYLFYIPGAGAVGVVVVSRLVFNFFLNEEGETYAPLILEKKAERLRNDNNGQFRSRYATDLTAWQSFQQKARAPFNLLFTDWLCAWYALLAGVVYAPQYFMFTTMHHVFIKAFSSDNSAPVWKGGFHFWIFGVGVCIGHGCCVFMPRILRRTNDPVNALGLRLVIGTCAIIISVSAYGWIPYVHTGTTYFPMIAPLWALGIASVIMDWSVHEAMKATFNDENGDREPAARAASVIVLAILGTIIPPFGLLVMDHLEPGPGSTTLLGIWVVLVAGVYVLIKDESAKAARAQSGD